MEMEDEFKMYFERYVISADQIIRKKCAKICGELSLTPRQMLNQLFCFLEKRKRPGSDAGVSIESAKRILTLQTLEEFCASLDNNVVASDVKVDYIVPVLQEINIRNPAKSNNLKAFLEISLMNIKDICSFYDLSLSPLSEKYLSSEICIGGIVLKHKDTVQDSTFLRFKVRTSSDDERELKVLISYFRKYEWFVGQTMLIRGEFLRKFFVATRIYINRCYYTPSRVNVLQQFNIIIAKGPFILNDSIFETEFIKHVIRNSPNYLILFGPFCERTLNLEGFVEKLSKHDFKLILVSSLEDDRVLPVFPQPYLTLERNYSNVILLPNPFLIKLNGVLIGGTSTDVLSHLKAHRIADNSSANCGIDEMIFKLSSHVIHSKSFYPLYPPDEINVDYELLSKFGQLIDIPNILVLCSKLKEFTLDLRGCIIINPENCKKSFVTATISGSSICSNISYI